MSTLNWHTQNNYGKASNTAEVLGEQQQWHRGTAIDVTAQTDPDCDQVVPGAGEGQRSHERF